MTQLQLKAKTKDAMLRIAEVLKRDCTPGVVECLKPFFPKFRANAMLAIPDINVRSLLASKAYVAGYTRRREIEYRAMGLEPWAQKRVEETKIKPSTMGPRRRKKENARRKKAKQLENHARRAEVNRARSNDVMRNPTWHGIGHN